MSGNGSKKKVKTEDVLEFLKELSSRPNLITMKQYIDAAVEISGLTERELRGRNREKRINPFRQATWYMMREGMHVHPSYETIGRQFSGRDHATVLHGFRKIRDMVRDHGRPLGITEEYLTRSYETLMAERDVAFAIGAGKMAENIAVDIRKELVFRRTQGNSDYDRSDLTIESAGVYSGNPHVFGERTSVLESNQSLVDIDLVRRVNEIPPGFILSGVGRKARHSVLHAVQNHKAKHRDLYSYSVYGALPG